MTIVNQVLGQVGTPPDDGFVLCSRKKSPEELFGIAHNVQKHFPGSSKLQLIPGENYNARYGFFLGKKAVAIEKIIEGLNELFDYRDNYVRKWSVPIATEAMEGAKTIHIDTLA